jgi:hypothetical protein
MLLLGCTPPGRFTEQHDVFFGIAASLKELVPQIVASWPEANGKIHIDAWREVTYVDGWRVEIVERGSEPFPSGHRLYFLNLGGYRENAFDELHYKMLAVAESSSEAIRLAKQTVFYKETGFTNAVSHIDDKYALDVDDLHSVADILPEAHKQRYALRITRTEEVLAEDVFHLGYLPVSKIK